jgi:hypothetical protein
MHAWCVRTVQWGFNSWSTSPAHAAVWTHLIKEKPAVGIEFYCRHVRTFAVYCLSARSTWVCKAFTVTPVLCQHQALREQMNMHAELNLCIVGLRSPWWAPSSTVETWLVEIFKHGCACTWRSPVAGRRAGQLMSSPDPASFVDRMVRQLRWTYARPQDFSACSDWVWWACTSRVARLHILTSRWVSGSR